MVSDQAFRSIPLTHAQLAARLGTVRELVARAFLQLEQSSVIMRRGRVVIRIPFGSPGSPTGSRSHVPRL
jgi:hypothetical protein